MRLELPEYTDEEFEKSLERAKKLAPLGGGHNNFLSGIRVAFDLVYPNYISPEMQRYTFFKIVNSSSKMHRLEMMASRPESYNKYVTKATIDQMSALSEQYHNKPTYKNFMRLLSNCPQGIELFMRCTTNYLCLRNMYKQRNRHKLKEDWGAFCAFVESLPYAKELILV